MTLSCPLDHFRAHILVCNTVSKCGKCNQEVPRPQERYHRPRPSCVLY